MNVQELLRVLSMPCEPIGFNIIPSSSAIALLVCVVCGLLVLKLLKGFIRTILIALLVVVAIVVIVL